MQPSAPLSYHGQQSRNTKARLK